MNTNNYSKKNNIFYFNKTFIKIYQIFCYFLILMLKKKKKKIGVVGIGHGNNIGNNLIKYAISIKLNELGFDPIIIGNIRKNNDISFINKTLKLKIIYNNYTEINRNEYDVLMVNSDQTWRKLDKKYFYDYAFLCFARKWKIQKFIYGASLGFDHWTFTKQDENFAKECLQNFTGISIREKGSINLIEKHLGIKPVWVLDPTFLINKKYYLNIIRNYKYNGFNDNFIFTYLFFKKENIKKYIEKSHNKLGYKIKGVTIFSKNRIEKFIYGIANCKAVITDSYHGTIFSIIFNKPFVTFFNKNNAVERFNSLKKLFKIENRFFNSKQIPNINLLKTPLNINKNLMNNYKKKSINYLKNNLNF